MAYHDICRYPSFVPDKAPTFSNLWQRLLALAALCLGVTAATAQVLQNNKATEALIKRYVKMVADGALLSPEGWKRASDMFERTIDYPVNSDIQLISIPGIIGEPGETVIGRRLKPSGGITAAQLIHICDTGQSHLAAAS